MEKEKLVSMIIDYIDGKGSEAERAATERELAQNKEAYALYEQLREVVQAMDNVKSLEPSGKLKAEFEKALQNEIASEKKNKNDFLFTAILSCCCRGAFGNGGHCHRKLDQQ